MNGISLSLRSGRIRLMLLSLILRHSFILLGQGLFPGALDPTFFGGWAGSSDDHPLHFIGSFPDDSILISQDRKLRKLTPDGSADYSFKYPPGLYGVGAVDPSGLIALTYAAPTTGVIIETHLRWFEPDGTIAKEVLLPKSGYSHSAVAFQADGKILIWDRGSVYRLNQNASLDTTFVCDTSPSGGSAKKILIQPDGRVILVGSFLEWGNLPRKGIARLNPDGSLDASYAPGVYLAGPQYLGPFDAALDSKNRLIVVGRFSTAFGQVKKYIVALLPDGSLAEDFRFEPTEAVQDTSEMAVAVHPNDKILFSGDRRYIDTPGFLLQLLPDGTIETSHRLNANRLVVRPKGDVVTAASTRQFYLLKSDGALDPAFHRKGIEVLKLIQDYASNFWVSAVYPDPNGNDRVSFYGISRLMENGAYRRVLVSSGWDPGSAFTFQGDKIIAANWERIYRITQDGQPDPTFQNYSISSTNTLNTIVVTTADKLLLGFSSRDWNANCLFRLNADGTPDQSFKPSVLNEVRSIQPLTNGQLLIGGGKRARAELLSILNENGTPDPNFVPARLFTVDYIPTGGGFITTDVAGTVNQAHQLPSGDIIVVGEFYKYGDIPKAGAVRLDRRGRLLPGFELKQFTSWTIVGLSVSVDNTGKVLIATGDSIQRFHEDGSIDPTWIPTQVEPRATSRGYLPTRVFIDSNGRIVVSGSFSLVNNREAINLARLFSSISSPRLTIDRGVVGDFILHVGGTPSGAAITEISADLLTWTPVATNYSFFGSVEIPIHPNDAFHFFRAKLR